MPNIQLIKLAIRRGTDEQRKSVVLEQGEVGFTTDHKRLWVGDGILSGGNVIGAKVHAPLESSGARTALNSAQVGDIVYENSLMYQLTATDYSDAASWYHVGRKPDNVFVTSDASNKLTLKDNCITGSKFAASAAHPLGPIIVDLSYGLSVGVDSITISVSSNQLVVKPGGLTEEHINSTALGNGIEGGSGSPITLDVDLTHFGFTGNTLQLSSLPAGSVDFNSINSSIIGDGLVYDGTSSTIAAALSGVDSTLENTAGIVGLKTIGTGSTVVLPQITKDAYGRVVESKTSIWRPLTCAHSTEEDTLSSIFNGYPNQSEDGRVAGLPLTTYDTISSNTTDSVTLTLSSAGFITLENAVAENGAALGKIAIPIFNY